MSPDPVERDDSTWTAAGAALLALAVILGGWYSLCRVFVRGAEPPPAVQERTP